MTLLTCYKWVMMNWNSSCYCFSLSKQYNVKIILYFKWDMKSELRYIVVLSFSFSVPSNFPLQLSASTIHGNNDMVSSRIILVRIQNFSTTWDFKSFNIETKIGQVCFDKRAWWDRYSSMIAQLVHMKSRL